jgi:four helix bundle protein
MKTFEDLKVFQSAMDLRVMLHRITEPFPKSELFGIVSQLRRAAGSVTRNIAEGQGRLTFGEWRQLLSEARGSLFEVESELIAAQRLGYIDEATLRDTQNHARKVGAMHMGLIRYVQRREAAAKQRKPRSSPGNSQPATRN